MLKKNDPSLFQFFKFLNTLCFFFDGKLGTFGARCKTDCREVCFSNVKKLKVWHFDDPEIQ